MDVVSPGLPKGSPATELHESIEKSKFSEVVSISSNLGGYDIVKNTDAVGATPLHQAICCKHTILSAGQGEANLFADMPLDADINAKDNQGHTPLNLAIQAGNKQLARKLIEAGAKIQVINQ